MTNAEIADELVQWLEKERRACAAAAESSGIGLSVQVPEHVVESLMDTQATFTVRQAPVSPMRFPIFRCEISRFANPCPELERCATQLHEAFGDRCEVWTPFKLVNFQEHPVRWIAENVLARVRAEYLANLASLEHGDIGRARRCAESLLAMIDGDTLTHVTWLPVAGFRTTAVLSNENVVLRPLTDNEVGELYDSRSERMDRPSPRRLPFELDVPLERCALEVRTPSPKSPSVQPVGDGFGAALVLALQLLGFEPHGRGTAAIWTEPGPSLWNGGGRFRLPEGGSIKDIGFADLETAVALARKIPSEVFALPAKREHIALHRFSVGAADGAAPDALIDYVIALEALLLPANFEGELSFRFKLNGAHFLGRSRDERHRIFEDLQSVYKQRSILVHGKKGGSASEFASATRAARRLAGDMLVRALNEGFPTQDQLKDAALDPA